MLSVIGIGIFLGEIGMHNWCVIYIVSLNPSLIFIIK